MRLIRIDMPDGKMRCTDGRSVCMGLSLKEDGWTLDRVGDVATWHYDGKPPTGDYAGMSAVDLLDRLLKDREVKRVPSLEGLLAGLQGTLGKTNGHYILVIEGDVAVVPPIDFDDIPDWAEWHHYKLACYGQGWAPLGAFRSEVLANARLAERPGPAPCVGKGFSADQDETLYEVEVAFSPHVRAWQDHCARLEAERVAEEARRAAQPFWDAFWAEPLEREEHIIDFPI